jgi:hypothetical protein
MLIPIEFTRDPLSIAKTWSAKCESYAFFVELRDLLLTKLSVHPDVTSSPHPVLRRKIKNSDELFVNTDAKCLKLDVNKFVYSTDSFEIEIVVIVDSNTHTIQKFIDNMSITEFCNLFME